MHTLQFLMSMPYLSTCSTIEGSHESGHVLKQDEGKPLPILLVVHPQGGMSQKVVGCEVLHVAPRVVGVKEAHELVVDQQLLGEFAEPVTVDRFLQWLQDLANVCGNAF